MNSSSTGPHTPGSGLRNRNGGIYFAESALTSGGAESPTLTSSSDSSPPQATRGAESPQRLNDSMARSSFRTTVPVNSSATRKLIVRSDPALISCFDPVADKELYELWAPKR